MINNLILSIHFWSIASPIAFYLHLLAFFKFSAVLRGAMIIGALASF
ncbi:hypothetical protein SAMN02745247_02915 [Butyrivibrio hungatei DSM 14810]|uniref:Uncharacterized protein n=1 Tax=Butyrivibrio hungatei DSM 14810 TaxID=1121132 RepID=A0A1M7T392_9FIRM|nr:hypothetical protein SAMN02745247_02915 [Butyrivibrio hungatei DSM 14810]